MVDAPEKPALPQGGSGTAPVKKTKVAKGIDLDAAPEFSKGDRVWFWLEGGDDENGLSKWAADIVQVTPGFEGHYQISALVPGGPQFIPMAKATNEPTALCINPRE